MYYVYVLKSIKNNTRYIGSTHDVANRLKEHNNGKCRYTSGRMPWSLVYREAYATRAEAMRREKFLKLGQGRQWLDGVLSKLAGSANGRPMDSESINPGSNPGPAVLLSTKGSPP